MGSPAPTNARTPGSAQVALRVFVASSYLAAGIFFMAETSAHLSAAPRRPVPPPKVLNLVRQTLKRGAADDYAALEASIVRAYRQRRIPLHWVCLQAPGSPAAILYLNVYDVPSDLDVAGTTYRNMVPQHRE